MDPSKHHRGAFLLIRSVYNLLNVISRWISFRTVFSLNWSLEAMLFLFFTSFFLRGKQEFVSSRLDFGNPLLSGFLDSSLKTDQLIQNAAAGVVTGNRKVDLIFNFWLHVFLSSPVLLYPFSSV